MNARQTIAYLLFVVLVLLPPLDLVSASYLGVARAEEGRKPANQAELRYWLENMIWHHGFTVEEASKALAMTPEEIRTAMKALDISPANRPPRQPGSGLLVLPYPGGRHPRIGFLEGAIRPQRETKVSVFTPWDRDSYVVVDLPEAIWANGELLYLAHTHVPTVWTKKGITLERLEWNRHKDGTLDIERKLPNGVRFGARVVPEREGVRMELWLHNGSTEPLTGMRVQNCVMFKGCKGFAQQDNDNKKLAEPLAACHSQDGKRWVITGWLPCQRCWANPRCPCMHSDPSIPDCPPGKTRHIHGWLSFYEGKDIDAQLRRVKAKLEGLGANRTGSSRNDGPRGSRRR
jgi:hypothetical protein